MNKKPTPPRWATKLLKWYCDSQLLEEVQGDLQEAFEYQLRRIGEKKAQWDYVQNVLGFIRPYLALVSISCQTLEAAQANPVDSLRNG